MHTHHTPLLTCMFSRPFLKKKIILLTATTKLKSRKNIWTHTMRSRLTSPVLLGPGEAYCKLTPRFSFKNKHRNIFFLPWS